jgi:hypothetical protein
MYQAAILNKGHYEFSLSLQVTVDWTELRWLNEKQWNGQEIKHARGSKISVKKLWFRKLKRGENWVTWS